MTAADEELPDFDEDNEKETKEEPKEGDDKKKTGSYANIHATGFKDFLLKPELNRAIVDCGFEHPSEVQHECIPQAILGTDIICQAKSGMGKTAVFVLACLQQLDITKEEKQVKCMVLVHTRELAYQIKNEFDRFSKYFEKVKSGVIYGGIPIKQQQDMLKDTPPQIIIGTPGRVKDLVTRKDLKLDNIQFFILDECDKCLEKADMRKDVQEIFFTTPKKKQVMMFSATISESARAICRKLSRKAEEIFVDDKKLTLHGLQQHFVELSENEKIRKLNDLLDALDFNQVVVFVKTRQRASALDKMLQKCFFPSMCIHSDLKQEERLDRYRKFKEYQSRILVSTNLFGRGVDIERVNIVINFDMPTNSNEYLHRVGRAGRFGTKGLAITFVCGDEDKEVLKDTQDRFEVKITPLPDEIDSSSYMTN